MEKNILTRKLEAVGNVWDFKALFDLQGNPLEAWEVQTTYGHSWIIFDQTQPPVNGFNITKPKWFTESKHPNPVVASKRNAAKGYQVGIIEAPAKVSFGDLRGKKRHRLRFDKPRLAHIPSSKMAIVREDGRPFTVVCTDYHKMNLP